MKAAFFPSDVSRTTLQALLPADVAILVVPGTLRARARGYLRLYRSWSVNRMSLWFGELLTGQQEVALLDACSLAGSAKMNLRRCC